MLGESIENIAKSDKNVARIFVDYHLLPDISFNRLGLIKKEYFYQLKHNKSI